MVYSVKWEFMARQPVLRFLIKMISFFCDMNSAECLLRGVTEPCGNTSVTSSNPFLFDVYWGLRHYKF